MSLSIKVRGFKELRRDIKKLKRRQRNAGRIALNRVVDQVAAAGKQELRAEMGGAALKDIKKAFSTLKASKKPGKTFARVTIRQKAFGIEKLRQATKIRKQRGRRAYQVSFKGKPIRRAFRIPELQGGGSKVVFIRRGEKLKRLYGYTSTQETLRKSGTSKVTKAMEKRLEERFPIEFDRAIAHEARRAGF